MNDKSDTKRLAEALTNLATAITEIIELKIRESAGVATVGEPMSDGMNGLTPAEGWVDKKEMAEHFKISLRTLHGWMKKGAIPYVRLGRSVRFKLSQVDEAVNRRFKAEVRYLGAPPGNTFSDRRCLRASSAFRQARKGRPGTGQGRDCARLGNLAHAADC
jgi:excisionase family DNA binding protein